MNMTNSLAISNEQAIYVLDDSELEFIDGGFGNFAIGAAVGAVAYLGTAAITGSFSGSGFAGSIVAGAVTSGFSALAGGGRVAQVYFGGAGGLAGGAATQSIEHARDTFAE